MIVNEQFITLLIHLNYSADAIITLNNSSIVIIFNTTSKLPRKKSQSGIALTLFIEIVDKELFKYEIENIRWWYMADEHRKQENFSISEKRAL